MTSAYRTVFFLPDPALDWRIPVAALVSERGSLRIGVARQLPDDACVGGRARMALLRAGLDTLAHATSFDDLPRSLGPHFVAAPPREVQVDVEDVLLWVVEGMLPAPLAGETSSTRGPHRDTLGYQFFEMHSVAAYVRKRFQPAHMLHLNGAVSRLQPISHWVPGDHRLLLMEPVITRRRDWEREVASVVNVFYAYQAAVLPRLAERSVRAELVVYLVGGGRPDVRELARNAVQPAAARVVDVHDESQARQFAAEISEMGKQSPQGRFGAMA